MENRIRALRKQRGITMKQLGEVVDLAESTISQYETGKREPDNETLLRISEFFGVTVGYLLGAEANVSQLSDNHDVLEDVDVAFYGDFKELSEDEKETVRDMVRLMRQRKEKRSQ
ncbi:MAG: helix-turn-helix transcriptional regulator [Ruminococcaceae bacterium]|nr:helix-turn-helix transcriptional regulator [Oscillospiraceae bacterium]